MSGYILETQCLTRTLPGEIPVTLVSDVSVSIKAGEFVAINGPSGSGKSSLLYLLGLLDEPTSGKLLLQGEETAGLSEAQRAALRLEHLGFIFQSHFLLPEFSALENVALPIIRRGSVPQSEAFKRGTELLERLGLGAHTTKIPRKLSGGQSQRVAIARALANNPKIIFADEPTGNLDSHSSEQVQIILRELAAQHGTTVVVVTHDENFAARADRVIRIVDGKVQ